MVWIEVAYNIISGVCGGGDVLCISYSALSNSRTVLSKDQLLGCGYELGQTRDWEVFMVQVWIFSEDLIGLQDIVRQNMDMRASTRGSNNIPSERLVEPMVWPCCLCRHQYLDRPCPLSHPCGKQPSTQTMGLLLLEERHLQGTVTW